MASPRVKRGRLYPLFASPLPAERYPSAAARRRIDSMAADLSVSQSVS